MRKLKVHCMQVYSAFGATAKNDRVFHKMKLCGIPLFYAWARPVYKDDSITLREFERGTAVLRIKHEQMFACT